MRVLASLATLAVLAACAVPLEPTLTRGDYFEAQDTQGFLDSRPATAIAAMPTTGTANYTGRVAADLTGGSNGSILGDVRLETNYSSSVVTGKIKNINMYNDSLEPQQVMDGELELNGNVVDNKMVVGGKGYLVRVDNGFSNGADANVLMQGQFRTNTAPADTVTGTITGSATGGFDFTLKNGVFYAQ